MAFVVSNLSREKGQEETRRPLLFFLYHHHYYFHTTTTTRIVGALHLMTAFFGGSRFFDVKAEQSFTVYVVATSYVNLVGNNVGCHNSSTRNE